MSLTSQLYFHSFRSNCAFLHDHDRVDSASFVQNVLQGIHRQCKDDSDEETQEEPSSRVLLDHHQGHTTLHPLGQETNDDMTVHVSDSQSQFSAEELSMAVATSCVCALVLGFISGFMLARKCSCKREEENPYHVPYLNQ